MGSSGLAKRKTRNPWKHGDIAYDTGVVTYENAASPAWRRAFFKTRRMSRMTLTTAC